MTKLFDEITTGDSSRASRLRIAAGLVAAATPVIVTVAGLDQVVLARLATNHNEVAATDL